MSKEEIIEAIAQLTVTEVVELVKAMEQKFGVSAAAAGERGHAGDAREDGGRVRVLRGTLLPLLHVALPLHEDPQLVGADAFRPLLGRVLLRAGRVRVPRARRARLAGDEVLGPARAKAARRPALNALQSAANLL